MNFRNLVLAVILCLLVGFTAGQLTDSDSAWFQDLEKPSFYPPGYLFGLVWTALYVAMGVSLYFVTERTREKLPYILFGSQLLLNFAWTFIFFSLKSIPLALIEILLLLGILTWTTIEFKKHSQPAAILLLPYIAWVAFATVLTASILVLN